MPIASVLCLAALAGAITSRWQRSRVAIAQSAQRSALATAVRADLVDMETGHRGCLLLGEERYLEPDREAAMRLRGDSAALLSAVTELTVPGSAEGKRTS